MRSRGDLVRTCSVGTLQHLLSTVRQAWPRRTCGDVMLCGITLAELSLLVFMTPTFTALDWIYVLQHVIVLGVALTRHPPEAHDHSWRVTMACLVSYAYPYAQILYLGIVPGSPAWPPLGQMLVVVATSVSLASLVTLGRWFGIRPALRGLAQTGPYRMVRHPLYLAYLLGGRRLQLCRVERWHRPVDRGRMGVAPVSHPCRGAHPGSGCRVGGLCQGRALSLAARPVVTDYITPYEIQMIITSLPNHIAPHTSLHRNTWARPFCYGLARVLCPTAIGVPRCSSPCMPTSMSLAAFRV
jgi:protein-S-isoprenylcysteine O-methyltransferase Ste14